MVELLEDFKGLLILAILPGAAAAGYIALIIAESARDRRQRGRNKKKKGKDDERRN